MLSTKLGSRVTWRVVPLHTPRVIRRCSRCDTTRNFACTEKFRVNAQKRLLDVWLIYPVEWFLGPQGSGAFDTAGDAWAILVLDVTAKVVYGFVATARFKKLSLEDALRRELPQG